MRLKTTIEYSDPGQMPVTITLRGPLNTFEELAVEMRGREVAYYMVSTLLEQISEASRQLRGRVQIDSPQPAARVMTEGDIYS